MAPLNLETLWPVSDRATSGSVFVVLNAVFVVLNATGQSDF